MSRLPSGSLSVKPLSHNLSAGDFHMHKTQFCHSRKNLHEDSIMSTML